MTASQANQQPFRFQGVTSATAEHALDTIIQNSPGWQKPVLRTLKLRDGDSGFSWITCAQDTLVTLFPKLVTSRSLAEIAESSYLELAESYVLYCALPLMARNIFQPFFTRVAGGTFTRGARAATILSTIGMTLVGGESIIHYSRNLMTAKIFKKDKFSDVINLSQGQMQTQDHSEVVDKAKKRIMECVAICAGIMGASYALAKSGDKTKVLGKVLDPVAKQLTKHLDFHAGHSGGLFLSPIQQRLYMLLAVFPYLDSSRDKLERVETASRLALILPYLAFGQNLLQNTLLKGFHSFFKPILKQDGKPMSIYKLANQTMATHHQDTQAAIKAMAPLTLRKAVLTGVPLAFGVGFTGFGVILLSQFWTKYRYQHQDPQTKPQSLPSNNPASPPSTVNTLSLPAQFPAQDMRNQFQPAVPTGFAYQQSFSKPNNLGVPLSTYANPSALNFSSPYRFPMYSR